MICNLPGEQTSFHPEFVKVVEGGGIWYWSLCQEQQWDGGKEEGLQPGRAVDDGYVAGEGG